MTRGNAALGRVAHDPALLAFIKCHLTSVTRWNALRVLGHCPGRWSSASEIARAVHQPTDAVGCALEDLAAEAVVQRRGGRDGARYRLDPGAPSSRLLARLTEEVRRDPHLRRIIVARVVAREAVGALPAEWPSAEVEHRHARRSHPGADGAERRDHPPTRNTVPAACRPPG